MMFAIYCLAALNSLLDLARWLGWLQEVYVKELDVRKVAQQEVLDINGRVVISCTKEQEAKLKELAKAEGVNVSAYVLKKLSG